MGSKIKAISTVSEKGLTTIPKEIRKKLNIKKGDKIYWIVCEKDKSELIIIHEPLKFLKGRHTKFNLKYEELEHKADKLLADKVNNKSH